MIKRIDVIGINGIPIRVVFVGQNELCPNHPNHIEKHDMIEFYDSRFDNTPDGNLIIRYGYHTFKVLTRSSETFSLSPDLNIEIDKHTADILSIWISYLESKSNET
jgi:hypothetical protein